MKVSEVIRVLEDDGWYVARQSGSHRPFKHITKKGLVTVAGKPSHDLSKKTLASIWRQAQLRGWSG